ncbi:glycosyltransferase [Pseudorhodoferax sp.]|uniref:glycosyltransferase n=1 Tax=Pseudorhodoferax sp. TaxID=1993553 RepID=UPI002DD61F9D|nr:glycosyltransferase [Pseudorhodoferax sp.]
MSTAAPRIGIVVLTYNRSDALLAVLAALAPQCPHDAVVVVADDGSRAEHVAALRARLPRFGCRVVHAWHPDEGFTVSRARNLGAAQADVDYLVFIDGDCVPTPHFVREHLALARPGHFVNGSRVLLSEGMTQRVLAGRVDLSALSPMQWLALRLRGDVNKLAHLMPWTGAPGRVQPAFRWKGIRGCNFAAWRSDLVRVNGFDESFHGWGHEDADIVLRLHQAGLARTNGYFATEVFHLWHGENSRTDERANRQRVLDRLQPAAPGAGAVSPRAVRGLSEVASMPGAIVTELNS